MRTTQGNKFSSEVLDQVAILLETTNAMSIMARKVANALGGIGVKNSTFHEANGILNDAVRNAKALYINLEKFCEPRLLKAAEKSADKNFTSADKWDVIMEKSNLICQLLILYYSRINVNPDNSYRIQRAIRKLTGTDDYDVDALCEIYRLK